MRIRKKRYLEERIDTNSNLLLAIEKDYSNALDFIKDKEYLDFVSVFGNDNPIAVDLGCGFGSFLIEIAKKNPGINYIGVEKTSNVIVSAMEKVQKENLNNIKFLNIRIECLEKYIKDNSIQTIFLNFSNPLPKSTAEKQRLTSKRFLDIYKKLLNKDGIIIQKTDNKDFFEYSINSFNDNGYIVLDINYDLKNNPVEDNIITEHELKYMQANQNIHRLVAKLKQ